MNCEIPGCKNSDCNILVIIPTSNSPRGNLSVTACLECAHKSGAFCVQHDRPHLGFSDGSTACCLCIEDLISSELYRVRETHDRIMNALEVSDAGELQEFIEMGATAQDCSQESALLRLVAIKACRSDRAVEAIVQEIVAERSVRIILRC